VPSPPARDFIEAEKRYYEWLPAAERRKITCVMAMEYALEQIDKHGSAPVPPSDDELVRKGDICFVCGTTSLDDCEGHAP
jgi:hypothetical protein